ncbi:MAG: poly(3-hydroxyalkanoate) depolymerase [Phreatobacter sp.]
MKRHDQQVSGAGGARIGDTTDSARGEIAVGMHEVNGQTLRVAIRRTASRRPPLLMFNGIGASVEMASPLLEKLNQTDAVIFDIPGIGGSPAPAKPYRMSCIATLGHDLMRKLGHERFDVAGLSWGGALAQQVAHQYPRACRKLILAAAATGALMVPGNLWALAKLVSPRRYSDRGHLRSIAGSIYGGSFRSNPALVDTFAAQMGGTHGHGLFLQLRALLAWTSLFWLRNLRQPTLIMAGTDDPLIPVANAVLIAKLIPRARLQLIADGHLFVVTEPGWSAETMERFLDEPDETPPSAADH